MSCVVKIIKVDTHTYAKPLGAGPYANPIEKPIDLVEVGNALERELNTDVPRGATLVQLIPQDSPKGTKKFLAIYTL